MPTVRIISLKPDYDRLAGHRKGIVADLRINASIQLQEDLDVVEAFWFAPIDPDDAVNMLPISIDVEYSRLLPDHEIDELAEALLRVFTNNEAIPLGMTIGVWIKMPGQFHWKEKTKSADPIVGPHSELHFTDGTKQLILIAPDHSDAPYDARHNEYYWSIWVQTTNGEVLATRIARRDADAGRIWSEVSGALFQAVSSNEVGERTREVRKWIVQVHKAFKEREAILVI
jgi:hypothetical protein